jgi:hypothetical protein
MSGHLARRALSAALALVAAVLVLPAAVSAPASATDGMPVRVEITSINPVVLRPGEDLVVRATLHNDGVTTIEKPTAVLRINAYRMGSREEVAAWAERSPTDLAGQQQVSEAIKDPLAPGASASVVLTFPAERVSFYDLPGVWGPRGLAVEATDAGVRVGLQRTFVLWYPEASVVPVPVSVLLPVAGPASNPLSTTPDAALEAATAPQGPLARMLQAAATDAAIGLVVDPALVVRARAGSPQAKAWADSVSFAAMRHDTFTLPWSDPDVAAIAHAEQDDLFTVATDLARTSDVLGTGRRTMTWSAPDQLLDQPSASLAAAGDIAAMVTRTDPIGSPSADTHALAVTSAGRVDRLVPDGTLSAMLVDPTAVDPGATSATTAQRALAELAVIAREDVQPGPVLLAPNRDQVPDPAAVATLMTAFHTAPWVQVDSASTLLVGPAVDAAPRPADSSDVSELAPAQVDALARAREHAVEFSSVTPDPEALLAGVDDETLAPLALAWRSDPDGRSALVSDVVRTVSARTVGLSIAPLSDLNVVSADASTRVVVRNELTVPASVRLVLTPRKACLQVAPIDPVSVEAASSTSVDVRLKATANCDVTVVATLESFDGAVVAAPRAFSARVSPTIESVGTYVVGALLFVGLVLGVVRTVRRGQSARRGARTEAETGPPPPLPVLGGTPDEESGP